MPQQRHHHPILMNAKIDRIREGLGEDAAELLVGLPMRSCQFCDWVQLSIERSSKSVTKFLSSLFIIPRNGLIKVIPDFWKHTQRLHPRLALTRARNCSSVSARDGSRSNRAQRESSSFFSASLTSGSSLDSPMDCQSTSTSMSFSLTGSAWSLRSSFGVMAELSGPAFGIQVPDLRDSVLECSSPLELFAGQATLESAGGPAHSKTLPRLSAPSTHP